MSLIPSESYSFPDHFTRTVTPSCKPKNEESEAASLETRRKKPSIVALPSPKAQPAPATSPENSEAVRSEPTVPVPNPALRQASAPPARIPEAPARKIPLPPTLTPKVRWNTRALAQNVIQMKLARPVAVSKSQPDFFESFAQNEDGTLAKRRRRMKFRRFVTCESVALAVLLPLVILGLSHRPDNVALVWIMNILTIASAVAAALIPILFFALTPTLPESER